MVKLILELCFLAAIVSCNAASPVTLHDDQLSIDMRFTEEQEKLLKNRMIKDPRTGATQLASHWPMGPDGFVNVPIRIQPSEGFSA